MDHDGAHEDTWEYKEHDTLPYLKTMCYLLLSVLLDMQKGMEEFTGFGMKTSITLPSLTNIYFYSLRDENDESIYT